MPRQGNKGKSFSGSKSVKLGPGFPPQLLNRLLRSQRRCIPFRNTFLTMYNTSQCSRGIPNKSDSEQKYDNFYYSSPKAATDMGVSSSESHDLTAFYEMEPASFGVLSQITGFFPSLDRIVETTLRPLNLGPGGGSYNKPKTHLQWHDPYGSDWDRDPGSSLGPRHTSEFEADNTDSGASPPTTHLKVIVNTNAGKPLEGRQETLWERFARQAGEGGYAPFESKEEWELSHWLSTEGLSQGAIDCFWKLKWVSHNFLFTH